MVVEALPWAEVPWLEQERDDLVQRELVVIMDSICERRKGVVFGLLNLCSILREVIGSQAIGFGVGEHKKYRRLLLHFGESARG
jgi:hypothetical protein